MPKPELPAPDTAAYLWYMQGMRDEAAARDEGLNRKVLLLREDLESYSRGRGVNYATAENVLLGLMEIYCPSKLRRRFRRGF